MKTVKLIIHLRARLWQIVFKIVVFLPNSHKNLDILAPVIFLCLLYWRWMRHFYLLSKSKIKPLVFFFLFCNSNFFRKAIFEKTFFTIHFLALIETESAEFETEWIKLFFNLIGREGLTFQTSVALVWRVITKQNYYLKTTFFRY